jgi:hypothetical protein
MIGDIHGVLWITGRPQGRGKRTRRLFAYRCVLIGPSEQKNLQNLRVGLIGLGAAREISSVGPKRFGNAD